MRIAIVHDYLNQLGGAEKVVSAFHEIFPQAPIFTSIYNSIKLGTLLEKADIRPSFMQKIPLVFNFFKLYFMLYPLAFESFDLSEYEVILSSSSAYAKGIRKIKGQIHICYCYTPARFIWRYDDYVKREALHPLIKRFLPFLLEPVKAWDLENSKNVDYFIAISQTVAHRIRETYGRESDIINPPVDTQSYRPGNIDQDYFLIVSRLNTYKRIDIAVKAFSELGLPLKIIGEGPDRKNLENMAAENIEFLGHQPDQSVAKHYAECRALIFPGEEDFGIVPLEAMSSGRPVIAYKAGGAMETITDGETGLFFEEQTSEAMSRVIKRFQFETFNKQKIREYALKYDKEIFKQKIKNFVEEKVKSK